jgi:hypothetical protein
LIPHPEGTASGPAITPDLAIVSGIGLGVDRAAASQRKRENG